MTNNIHSEAFDSIGYGFLKRMQEVEIERAAKLTIWKNVMVGAGCIAAFPVDGWVDIEEYEFQAVNPIYITRDIQVGDFVALGGPDVWMIVSIEYVRKSLLGNTYYGYSVKQIGN